MSRILYLDIETIPCQKKGFLEEIKKTIKPPGNIKKQESIDKWMEENAEQSAEEQWRKTALNGSLGEIVCIGYAFNDEPAYSIGRNIHDHPSFTEAELLNNFFLTIYNYKTQHPSSKPALIVGHNVKDFDLRFLYQRSIVNKIKPSFPIIGNNRYSDEYIFDTMINWAGWGNRISLKNLCNALGISVKEGDIDGSMVWDYIKSGRYEEVAEYCKSDVEATRLVYKRLTFQDVA